MEASLVASLLADAGRTGTANPLASSTHVVSGQQHPPDLTHLEGRAVSAAFLSKFQAEKVTSAVKRRATAAAIPYLEAQIARREQAIKGLQQAGAVEDSDESRKRHEIRLGWLNEDLAKRKEKPFVPARDVHREIIKPETDGQRCRYCELPGLAEQKDPETGMYHFGDADHFFSYSWDTPFEDVVDAICTHSAAEVAEGKPPAYYFVDCFAINQHKRTVDCTPCADCEAKNGRAQQCERCRCDSDACRARFEDRPDWERVEAAAAAVQGECSLPGHREILGFERVIRHTQSTLMLMEPWHRPRAPTRAWCLFEGNITLLCGGRLVPVLGSKQQRSLQLSLGAEKFKSLQQMVGSLDSRTADATDDADQVKILCAIETLPGGHDELDRNIQTALRIWLLDAATRVSQRC